MRMTYKELDGIPPPSVVMGDNEDILIRYLSLFKEVAPQISALIEQAKTNRSNLPLDKSPVFTPGGQSVENLSTGGDGRGVENQVVSVLRSYGIKVLDNLVSQGYGDKTLDQLFKDLPVTINQLRRLL